MHLKDIYNLLSLFLKNNRTFVSSRRYFCVTQRLKSGILESEEKAVAMQRLGKHVPLSTNTHATVGPTVFYAVRAVSDT
jgi:hypothetical protein